MKQVHEQVVLTYINILPKAVHPTDHFRRSPSTRRVIMAVAAIGYV